MKDMKEAPPLSKGSFACFGWPDASASGDAFGLLCRILMEFVSGWYRHDADDLDVNCSTHI